jgi:hypothetical protein
MNGLFRVDTAQTIFVLKTTGLYGRRTDRRNSSLIGGVIQGREYNTL